MTRMLYTHQEKLLGLGVEPEVFTLPHLLALDSHGYFHAHQGRCIAASTGPFQVRRARIQDLTDYNECVCLSDITDAGPDTWRALGVLLDATELLGNAPWPQLVFHHQHYCELTRITGDLKDAQDICTEDTLSILLHDLGVTLEERTTESRAWFLSPEAHALHHHLLQGTPPGAEVAVGIPWADPRYAGLELLGALLLTYGTPEPQEGTQVVIVPRNIARRILREDSATLPLLYPLMAHYHTLTDEDTPEVIETVRALWSPTVKGAFTELTDTFQGARKILA